jgi:hypothetical protein
LARGAGGIGISSIIMGLVTLLMTGGCGCWTFITGSIGARGTTGGIASSTGTVRFLADGRVDISVGGAGAKVVFSFVFIDDEDNSKELFVLVLFISELELAVSEDIVFSFVFIDDDANSKELFVFFISELELAVSEDIVFSFVFIDDDDNSKELFVFFISELELAVSEDIVFNFVFIDDDDITKELFVFFISELAVSEDI